MNRASFLGLLAAVPFAGPALRKKRLETAVVAKFRQLGWTTALYGQIPTIFPLRTLSDLDNMAGARFVAWNTLAKHPNGPTFAAADEPVIRDVSGLIQTHTRPFTEAEKQYLKHRFQGYAYEA